MTIDYTDSAAELEQALASLTAGPGTDGASNGLWLKALEQAGPADATRSRPLWTRKLPTVWLAVAAGLVVMVLLVGVMLPSMSKARASSRSSARNEPVNGWTTNTPAFDAPALSTAPDSLAASDQARSVDGRVRRMGIDPPAPVPGAPAMSAPSAARSTDRFVIRKSTLDLTTTEGVRGAFAKAGLVVSEALGEYIENSSLTGEGPTAYATLTLRITSTRLSEALNQFRALGTVVTEAATGQDVTDTAVDLDARIRNEQRIEKELLALIDKRPDTPLKDLMEIRAQLTGVRGQIESLIGQRERLGRMVSLATVLVTIRPADAAAPEAAQPAGIGEYFKASVESSWRTSVQALVDTAAFFIRVIVGGIIWWALAAISFTVALRAYRRSKSHKAAEPVPVG